MPMAGLVDHFLYAHNRSVGETPVLYSVDGKVPCAVYGNDGPPAPRTLVYVHGNGTSLASLHESGMPQALSRACAAMVLAVELPGFGCDTGPALTGEARDRRCCEYVHAALRYLRRKGATNISVVGRSLGVGVVLKTFAMYPRLANNTPAVVLVSGFTSVKDMCSSAWLKPFVSERFCNRQNITMLAPRMRVAVVHGTADSLIPFEHAKRLVDARPGATLVPVVGMDHSPNANEMQHVAAVVANQLASTRGCPPSFDADVLDAKRAGAAPPATNVWALLCPV